jgi:hypothetical protein
MPTVHFLTTTADDILWLWRYGRGCIALHRDNLHRYIPDSEIGDNATIFPAHCGARDDARMNTTATEMDITRDASHFVSQIPFAIRTRVIITCRTLRSAKRNMLRTRGWEGDWCFLE